jgi:hypothetical protein
VKRPRHHAGIQLDVRCARGLRFHLATGFKIIAKMLGGSPGFERLGTGASEVRTRYCESVEGPVDGKALDLSAFRPTVT